MWGGRGGPCGVTVGGVVCGNLAIAGTAHRKSTLHPSLPGNSDGRVAEDEEPLILLEEEEEEGGETYEHAGARRMSVPMAPAPSGLSGGRGFWQLLVNGEPDGRSGPGVRTRSRSRRCCFAHGLCAPAKAHGRALLPLARPGPGPACVQPWSPPARPGSRTPGPDYARRRGGRARAGAEGHTAGVDAPAWRRPQDVQLRPRQHG